MPFRFPRSSSMEAESSTLTLVSLPADDQLPNDPTSVRFRSIAEILLRGIRRCVAEDRDLNADSERTPTPTNLFWAFSETLYPSRLISFLRTPSLCPTSPKRWVLETSKTCKTEVNREQRSDTQRHRGAVGQRCDSGQEAADIRQNRQVADSSRTGQ